jgi:hypothetical protein
MYPDPTMATVRMPSVPDSRGDADSLLIEQLLRRWR